jgi:hypothetical protein
MPEGFAELLEYLNENPEKEYKASEIQADMQAPRVYRGARSTGLFILRGKVSHKNSTRRFAGMACIRIYVQAARLHVRKGYEHVIDGHLISDFVNAVGKHSGYDVSEIRQEIEKKRAWYYELNPQ